MLLVPAPVRAEIDGVRRALGDGALGRIPAHLTLIPPVNVREDQLSEALSLVRAGASRHRPIQVDLGPPDTFLPDNPVVFLPVVTGAKDVVALREDLFAGPLERPLTWPFVPHVTVADEADLGRIEAALIALADFEVSCTFDLVHVLQEGTGRVWEPIASAPLAAPAVVGRGSLPLSLQVSSGGLDVDAATTISREWARHNDGLGLDGRNQLAVVARRDDEVLGAAQGWTSGRLSFLQGLIVVASNRGEGVGSHLLARFESEAADRGCDRVVLETLAGTAAVSWYEHKGWMQIASLPQWSSGRDNLFLEHRL